MALALAPAIQTLNEARKARAAGDVTACIQLADRAYEEATEEGEEEARYHARVAVGRMYMDREEPEYALPYLRDALSIAKNGGLVCWLPPAYLDLAIANHEAGQAFNARRLIGASLDIFRDFCPKHPRMAALVAYLGWQEYVSKQTSEAASHCGVAYRSLAATIRDPAVIVYASARQMRCAASAGLRGLYLRSKVEMEEAMGRLPDMQGVASDVVVAAEACREFGDHEAAARFASLALSVAEHRGEDRVAQRALALT